MKLTMDAFDELRAAGVSLVTSVPDPTIEGGFLPWEPDYAALAVLVNEGREAYNAKIRPAVLSHHDEVDVLCEVDTVTLSVDIPTGRGSSQG